MTRETLGSKRETESIVAWAAASSDNPCRTTFAPAAAQASAIDQVISQLDELDDDLLGELAGDVGTT